MKYVAGVARKRRRVKCSGLNCDEVLLRGSWWNQAKCKKCSTRVWRKTWQEREKEVRQQARRYRILMTVSPYGSFEELLEALKIRNPRTGVEIRDWNKEARCGA